MKKKPSKPDAAALFDLHVHSHHSPDARGSVQELAKQAQWKGLQGFAVTDHNVFDGREEIRRARIRNLLVVPGMEVSTTAGHCLAIGIQEAVVARRPLAETLEAIRDAGGVGIPSHPFRWVHGVGGEELRAARKHLVAIEVYNARDGANLSNRQAEDFATQHKLGGTGGSDTHQVVEIGNAYAVFPEFPQTVDDLVSQIRKRKTWGGGTPTPRSKIFFQNFRNTLLWAKRGFRSI